MLPAHCFILIISTCFMKFLHHYVFIILQNLFPLYSCLSKCSSDAKMVNVMLCVVTDMVS